MRRRRNFRTSNLGQNSFVYSDSLYSSRRENGTGLPLYPSDSSSGMFDSLEGYHDVRMDSSFLVEERSNLSDFSSFYDPNSSIYSYNHFPTGSALHSDFPFEDPPLSLDPFAQSSNRFGHDSAYHLSDSLSTHDCFLSSDSSYSYHSSMSSSHFNVNAPEFTPYTRPKQKEESCTIPKKEGILNGEKEEQLNNFVDETPSIVDETPSIVDETPSIVDETPSIVDETSSLVDETPLLKKETADKTLDTKPSKKTVSETPESNLPSVPKETPSQEASFFETPSASAVASTLLSSKPSKGKQSKSKNPAISSSFPPSSSSLSSAKPPAKSKEKSMKRESKKRTKLSSKANKTGKSNVPTSASTLSSSSSSSSSLPSSSFSFQLSFHSLFHALLSRILACIFAIPVFTSLGVVYLMKLLHFTDFHMIGVNTVCLLAFQVVIECVLLHCSRCQCRDGSFCCFLCCVQAVKSQSDLRFSL